MHDTCEACVAASTACDCDADQRWENNGARCWVVACHVSTGYGTNRQSISADWKSGTSKRRPSRARRSMSAAPLAGHCSSSNAGCGAGSVPFHPSF